MKRDKVIKLLSLLPPLLVMLTIFSMSAQNSTESSSLSLQAGVAVYSAENVILHRGWTMEYIRYLSATNSFIIRKAAHFLEYMLLGITMLFPCIAFEKKGLKRFLISVCVCVCYAALDEFHQMFVSGRYPSLTDVGIDSLGACCGILVTFASGMIRNRTVCGENR